METILNAEWTADVVGRMHRCKITNAQLAQECGYTPAYLSTVLNGNKDFKSESGEAEAKDRILSALNRLESRILTTGTADTDGNESNPPDED